MQRYECSNIGGLSRAFIATRQGAESAWNAVGKFEAEVIQPDAFELLPFEKGQAQYTEGIEENDAGVSYPSTLTMYINKDRRGILDFEDKYRLRELTMLAKDHAGQYRLFEYAKMVREARSGEGYANPNGVSYTFSCNNTYPARWVDAIEEPVCEGTGIEIPTNTEQLLIEGNGSNMIFNLNHNLGRKPYHATAWRLADDRIVEVGVRATATGVEVEFAYPLAVGEAYVLYLS